MDKIKTIGPGVSLSPPFFFSKPREFANLIRNKFGSADNISSFKASLEASSPQPDEGAGKGLSSSTSMVAKPRYPSDDECSSGSASVSADNNGHPEGGATLAEPTQPREELQSRLTPSLEELAEIRDGQSRLEDDLEELKAQFTKEYGLISRSLQEERFRCGCSRGAGTSSSCSHHSSDFNPPFRSF